MNLLSRANVALAYLAATLLLGGASSAGYAGNLALQLAGAGLIFWTMWDEPAGPRSKTGLSRFGAALLLLAIVQFLPLPPALWQLLPGRGTVYQGFELIGAEAPWMTISLSPWKSLSSLTWWLPALAVFIVMRGEYAPPVRRILPVLMAVAVISAVIGAIQRGVGVGYFYTITNFGEGPGFFANSNHQGSFLLMVLALWGGALGSAIAHWQSRKSRRSPPVMQLVMAGVLIFGILVSGSLACVALLGPVCLGLVMIARPRWRIPLLWVACGSAILVAGFAAFLLLGPVANDLTAKSATPGISRQEFLFTGLQLLRDFAPLGSGLGTFPELYRWYEQTALIGTTFVNHAHNDLLELLIETGIFGLAALALFLHWFGARSLDLWRQQRSHSMALAASIAIGTVLAHSLVDYPLRTAAMSVMLALACALLERAPEEQARNRRREEEPAEERPMLRI